VEDAKQVTNDVFEVTNVLATAANLSVSREHFDKAKGFDAGYPFGCEDQDFAGRLTKDGVHAFATNKSIATHVETHNSLRRICQRQRLGAMDTARFIRRFAVDHHCGEQAIATANGPIRLKTDGPSLIVKKIARQLVASRPLSHVAFACTYLLERAIPESHLLSKVYDLIVSAWVQKGWREGTRVYESEPPLSEWAPDVK
jgi:GT2 family glycosyltransferase